MFCLADSNSACTGTGSVEIDALVDGALLSQVSAVTHLAEAA